MIWTTRTKLFDNRTPLRGLPGPLWGLRRPLRGLICIGLILQAGYALAQTREIPRPLRGINGIPSTQQFQSLGASNGLKFIPNRGQLSDQNGKAMPEVLYTLDGYGVKTYFTKGSMHYVFSKRSGPPHLFKKNERVPAAPHESLSLYRVDVKFIGSNPDPEIIASDTTEDYTNYYLTNCPDGITHVPGYCKIVYRDIYPHIDLVLYTNGNDDPTNPSSNPRNPSLEYDFIVHPGGDPGAIRMRYDHASSLSVDEDGLFHLASPFGRVDETKPNGYQLLADSSENVPCGFKLTQDTVTFETGAYDGTRDLYIDPQRLWGSYFRWADTNNYTQVTGLAVDRSGNADLYGYTDGTANIATSGAYQTKYGGGSYDCFLAKFGSGGNLLWSTYYGGSGDDYSSGVACDTARGIAITGFTSASGSFIGFLASFDSTGSLRWDTTYENEGYGVAVDSASNIIFTGEEAGHTGPAKAFVAKFSSKGSLLWTTTISGTTTPGGDPVTIGWSVGADLNDNIYFNGSTTFTAGIATAGAYQTSYGPSFFAKLSPSGAIDWTTYYQDSIFPDRISHQIYQIAVSRSGNLYFVGYDSLPADASPGAYQTSLIGDTDAFFGKFNTNGKRIWATYYGNSPSSALYALTLDSAENIFACGETYSPTGIATPGEFQTTLLGPYNPFIIKFDSGGHRKWGTYYERRGIGFGIGLDPSGHPFVGGTTYTGTDEYATTGAYDGAPYGDANGFIVKFCDPLELLVTSNVADTVCPGSSLTLTTTAGLAAYQWLQDGSPISGATYEPYSLAAPEIPGTYYYSVNAVGKDGCDAISDTVALVVRRVPTVTIPQTNYAICAGSSVQFRAAGITGWTGPLTYAWTPAATLANADSLDPIATPKQPTTYTLSVTDSNGCVTIGKVFVSFFGQPKITLPLNPTVCSGSSLSITAATTGGTEPFTFAWSPATGLNRTDSSTVIATVAKNTTYHVTVTDQNGCATQDSVLVVVSAGPKVSTGPPLSICQSSSIKIGASISGGVLPYKILWTPSATLSDSTAPQPTASPSVTTLYTITVTDKNGCTTVDSVLVTVSDSLLPTITGVPAIVNDTVTICAGDTANLSVGTGYTSYAWSDGEKTATIAVAHAGDYAVHVTSGAGCSGTSNAVHVKLLPDSVPHPVLSASQTTICEGASATVQTTKPYASYLWSTGDTGASIVVTSTDTVTVTATNANGCSGTSAPVVITVLPTPNAAITTSGPTTFCSGDSVTLAAAGGYAKYRWSSGDTTSSIIVKNSGTYSVSVSSVAGCSATSQPDTVTVNSVPMPVISGPASIAPGAQGTYKVNNVPGDSYLWTLTPATAGTITSPTSANSSIQWGSTGTATLTLTETSANGCSATVQLPVTINSNLMPVITANGPLVFCPGDSVTLDAGAGYATYQWSDYGTPIAGATKEYLTVSTTGAYTVFVTSGGGASGTSAAADVMVYPAPAQPVFTLQGDQLVSSPASAYQWYLNGVILKDSVRQSITLNQLGVYTVTITDSNGCQQPSGAFLYSTVTTAQVSVQGGIAAPGDTVSIPILLDSGINLPASGGSSYAGFIGLDAGMLTPVNPVGVLQAKRAPYNGPWWMVPIAGTVPNAPGVLQTITAIALDSGLCSPITIDSFTFLPGTSVLVTTVNANFCLTDFCRPVVSNGAKAFMIEKVFPNPAADASFTMEYFVSKDGPVSISLQDELGRTVCQLKDTWTAAGDKNETYSVQGISSGRYRLILRSGSQAASALLVVAK